MSETPNALGAYLRARRELVTRLSIGGAEGLMLVVFHPDAGSGAADKLALLASADLPARARDESRSSPGSGTA